MEPDFIATIKLTTGEELISKVSYMPDDDSLVLENPMTVTHIAQQKKNVHVKLTGSCAGCAASSFTLKLGVEETLKEYLPNDVESVSHEEGEVINPYY